MKYTENNIQGIICQYSPENNGKFTSVYYIVDNYKAFTKRGFVVISWSIPDIIKALNNGQFVKIDSLIPENYEIY